MVSLCVLVAFAAASVAAAGSPAAASLAQPPVPASCSGTPNVAPMWTGTPSLVATAANGLKYTTLNASVSPPITVLHVYGTSYEMGLAYGTLLREEIGLLVPAALSYFGVQLNESLPSWVPEAFREEIMTRGLEWALDLTYNATFPYTPGHHYDVMSGMAAGAGMDYMTLARMSMIPELVKADCSILLAWGNATRAGASAGDVTHLRALDWASDGPFQQWPVVVTYHPADGGAVFTSVSWAGFHGTLTGVSSSGLSVGEKVWLAYQGAKPIFGYVWTFLLEDIMRYDVDMDQALSRIASANRTCSVWLGLADHLNVQGKVVAYSNQQVSIYNDRNFPAYPEHDLFPSLLFINKHVQPSTEPCMNDMMHAYYGSIDGPLVAGYVAALEQTGDMHIGIVDWTPAGPFLYVSNAGIADPNGTSVPAYDRPYFRFDLNALWATPNPSQTQ